MKAPQLLSSSHLQATRARFPKAVLRPEPKQVNREAIDRFQETARRPIAPETPAKPGELVLMGLNTENLFNPADAPDKQDEEYTKAKGYDQKVLDLHVDTLSRTILGVNGGRGPDVVGLTEVEDRTVVEQLAKKAGYSGVVHFETPDVRGIDQALMTRLPVKGSKYHPITAPDGKELRGIVQADLDAGGKTLTVLVNHWPSKRSGSEGAENRQAVAAEVRKLVDQLMAEDPERAVVLLGDLNEDLGEGVRGPSGIDAKSSPDQAEQANRLYDTMFSVSEMAKNDPSIQVGTHFYPPQRTWSSFDAMIVSPGLTDLVSADCARNGLAWVPDSTAVYAPEWAKLPNGQPKRFFDRNGRPYKDPGVSDHFSVVTRLVDLDAAGKR